MMLVPKKIREQLIRNRPDQDGPDKPPLKIFNPARADTWII